MKGHFLTLGAATVQDKEKKLFALQRITKSGFGSLACHHGNQTAFFGNSLFLAIAYVAMDVPLLCHFWPYRNVFIFQNHELCVLAIAYNIAAMDHIDQAKGGLLHATHKK